MVKIITDIEQGTDEWLELRRKHVTATDMCKIMGAVPKSWGTAYSCWIDKMTGSGVKVNAAMKRGTDLEPFARTAYNDRTGYDCVPVIAISEEHPWMMASMDGLSSDLQHAVEIKCPGEKACELARSGVVADYYIPQLQHQMCVLGLNSIDYCVYDGRNIATIITVARDDKYISKIIKKGKNFYDMLNTFTPPPTNEIYYEMVESHDALASSKRLQNARDQMKELNKIVDEEKAFLSSVADGRNVQVGELKLTKVIRKGNINYKAIPGLSDLDLEKYRCESTDYYKFS